MKSSNSVFQWRKYLACIIAQGNCLAGEINLSTCLNSIESINCQEVDSDVTVVQNRQSDSDSQKGWDNTGVAP